MGLRYIAPCALLLAALVSCPAIARADATADLRAFVGKSIPLTFAGYVGLHGAPVAHHEGEWTSPAVYGPSLSRCLVVDLPSMASLFGGPSDGPPYSSALQCDGKRNAMTQKQLVAWAIATITPLAPGRTMKQYPPTKRSDRWSVAWKNGRGQTIEFIAYGKSDVTTYPRASYVVDIEQLSPDAMATPTPAP